MKSEDIHKKQEIESTVSPVPDPPHHQHWHLTIILGAIFAVCTISDLILLIVLTDGFNIEITEFIATIDQTYWLIINILTSVAGISFLIFASLLTTVVAHSDNQPTGPFRGLKSAAAYSVTLAILPIAAMFRVARSRRSLISRLFIFLISLCFLLPLWGLIYLGSSYTLLSQFALVSDQVSISGTGSMYPTFPKSDAPTQYLQSQVTASIQTMDRYPRGITLFGTTYFDYQIQHGDIVSFENQVTDSITADSDGETRGFIKRIVGLPGDVLEIRDGLFYRNQQPLLEPYTATARSTFGGEFLPECQSITIPDGYAFVAGDNRKASNDSRHDVGLILISDIDHVISVQDQQGRLDQYYRDISDELADSARIQFDPETYVKLLNVQRTIVGLSPLKPEPLLDRSSAHRAAIMMEYDDLSFEATASGYDMSQAMSDVGYSNIVYGESSAQGYYTAEEMIEYQFSFPDSAKFLLDPEYDDIGVAAV